MAFFAVARGVSGGPAIPLAPPDGHSGAQRRGAGSLASRRPLASPDRSGYAKFRSHFCPIERMLAWRWTSDERLLGGRIDGVYRCARRLALFRWRVSLGSEAVVVDVTSPVSAIGRAVALAEAGGHLDHSIDVT